MVKVSKAFAAALKKKAKQFKKSRKAVPGQFSIPKIDDGSYVARITMQMKMVGPDKKLQARFDWTIARGAFKGVTYNKTVWLDDEDSDRDQENWDNLSRCLQVLGYDMDDIDVSDLIAIADEVTKEKPLIKIGVKNNTDPKDSDKKYLNSYFNLALDDEDDELEDEEEEEEDEDEEAEAEEEEEEEATDEEEEEDEEGEEEEEEEEEYEAVEKDMEVTHKRKKCTVISSNQRKETCSLKQKKSGKVIKNVSWDDVTILE